MNVAAEANSSPLPSAEVDQQQANRCKRMATMTNDEATMAKNAREESPDVQDRKSWTKEVDEVYEKAKKLPEVNLNFPNLEDGFVLVCDGVAGTINAFKNKENLFKAVLINKAARMWGMSEEITTIFLLKLLIDEDPEMTMVCTESFASEVTNLKAAELLDSYLKPVEDRKDVINCLIAKGQAVIDRIQTPPFFKKFSMVENADTEHMGLYATFSQKGCFTSLHYDLCGSSTINYLHKGKKVWLLIEPTEEAVKMHEKFDRDGMATINWAFDKGLVQKVVMEAGSALYFTGATLHAVFTMEDSLMTGGNFLTPEGIPVQLEHFDLDVSQNAKVDEMFPSFVGCHIEYLRRLLKNVKEDTKRGRLRKESDLEVIRIFEGKMVKSHWIEAIKETDCGITSVGLSQEIKKVLDGQAKLLAKRSAKVSKRSL